MQTTIEKGAPVVTLINVFTVDPSKQDELVYKLELLSPNLTVDSRCLSSYSTVSTFMKFVFPGTCRGAPPVMTRCWPDSINPERRAASIE